MTRLTKETFEALKTEHGNLVAYRLMGLDLVLRPLDRKTYREANERVSQEQQRGQSGDHARASVVRDRLVHPALEDFNATLATKPALARKAYDLLMEVAGEVTPQVTAVEGGHQIEAAGAALTVRPLTRPEYDRLRNEASKAQAEGGSAMNALEKAIRAVTLAPTGEELTQLLDRLPGLTGAVTAQLMKLAGETEEAEEITFL